MLAVRSMLPSKAHRHIVCSLSPFPLVTNMLSINAPDADSSILILPHRTIEKTRIRILTGRRTLAAGRRTLAVGRRTLEAGQQRRRPTVTSSFSDPRTVVNSDSERRSAGKFNLTVCDCFVFRTKGTSMGVPAVTSPMTLDNNHSQGTATATARADIAALRCYFELIINTHVFIKN